MSFYKNSVLINEIVLQSKIALRAFEKLENYEKSVDIWLYIQSILVSSANISKILWPKSSNYKIRAIEFRLLLNIADDNILSSREFRNHFEHFDERIEDYFKEYNGGLYLDLFITSKHSTNNLDMEYNFIHRSYDICNQILIYKNSRLNLKIVKESILEIYKSSLKFALDTP